MGVVAIGELLVDFISEDGYTYRANPGGAPCNYLTAIKKFGIEVGFIGKIGNDNLGHMLKEYINNIGIDTKWTVFGKQPTTLAFVTLDASGERDFSFYRDNTADVNLEFDPLMIEYLKKHEIFHFGSLSLSTNPIKDTLYILLKEAKKLGLLITYDPNYRPLLWEDENHAIKMMLEGLKYADFVKLSMEEALLLANETDLLSAAEILLRYGPSLILITDGENGSYIVKEKILIHVKGYFVDKVVDTTGAGDTFFGSFIGYLLSKGLNFNSLSIKDIEKGMNYANCAASICIKRYGAMNSIPNMSEVMERLNVK
jgi:fructokinase